MTPAEIEAHAKANEAKLKQTYDQRKFLYENAPKERRLRQILVKLDSGASADATAAAEKKAQALVDRLKKGEAFAAVAQASSDDARSKGAGRAGRLAPAGRHHPGPGQRGEGLGGQGRRGGRPAEGQPTASTWWSPEATREGNITFEQVQLELAETELRQERAKAKAKAEADAALAKAKAGQGQDAEGPVPGRRRRRDRAASDVPHAEETGLFQRRGAVVEGLGTAPELAKAAFTPGSGRSRSAGPFEVAGSYVIVRLKERKQADAAEFEKKKAELMQQAAMVRAEEILSEWTQRRCVEAKQDKRHPGEHRYPALRRHARGSGRLRALHAAVPALIAETSRCLGSPTGPPGGRRRDGRVPAGQRPTWMVVLASLMVVVAFHLFLGGLSALADGPARLAGVPAERRRRGPAPRRPPPGRCSGGWRSRSSGSIRPADTGLRRSPSWCWGCCCCSRWRPSPPTIAGAGAAPWWRPGWASPTTWPGALFFVLFVRGRLLDAAPEWVREVQQLQDAALPGGSPEQVHQLGQPGVRHLPGGAGAAGGGVLGGADRLLRGQPGAGVLRPAAAGCARGRWRCLSRRCRSDCSWRAGRPRSTSSGRCGSGTAGSTAC